MSWMFLSRLAVGAMHDEQLRRHGGARGICDENALECALVPMESKAADEEPDIHGLAAAYVFGIARNHAFVDGNKRTVIVAAGAFLLIYGYRMTTDDALIYTFVMALAAGEIDEAGAAASFRDHTVPFET